MPRKQQHGAGFLDFMNSDPKKKIETNTKKIEELEKDSETKCEAIKKANAEKIKSLTDENAKLQAQVDAKANEKPAESIASRFSGLFSFGQSAEAKDKPVEAKAPEAEDKPVEVKAPDTEAKPVEAKAPEADVKPVVGNRLFGGRKSKKQNRKSAVAAAAGKSKRRKSNKK
jgi:predicted nuclease with TOPRIM domain